MINYCKELHILENSMYSTKNLLTAAALTVGFVISGLSGAMAGTVTGGSLLDDAGADQLETWLGVGDQDFNNIWAGDAGVATASDFHANVDGVGATFSIYDVTIWDGSHALIGGYTSLDWEGKGYLTDLSAFIFNLTTGEAQFSQETTHSIYRRSNQFATFGGGNDIFAGRGILGTCDGVTSTFCDGSTNSWTYDNSQGQISIAGDSGSGSGNSGQGNLHIAVNSLEVYTFAVAVVPLPAGGLLLLSAMGGLAMMRRRKRQS